MGLAQLSSAATTRDRNFDMTPRIVSLLASATETVYALGMGRFLVGRSHECDYPPEVKRLPVLTGPRIDVSGTSRDIDQQVREVLRRGEPVYWVNAELLRQLRPTVIVTQEHCEVCAVSLQDVQRAICSWESGSTLPGAPTASPSTAAALGEGACPMDLSLADGSRLTHAKPSPDTPLTAMPTLPVIVTLKPHCLADVWQGMLDIGMALGVAEKAQQLVASLQQCMHKLCAALPADAHRPTVICLEWLDPLMSAGNWMPELVELAGGISLLDEPGRPSTYLPYDDLRQADPEVIIILPCGWDLERTWPEIARLERLPGWRNLYAVRHGRVYVADGNQFFNRPGPRLAESVEILAEILHPQRLTFGYRGQAWQSVYQV